MTSRIRFCLASGVSDWKGDVDVEDEPDGPADDAAAAAVPTLDGETKGDHSVPVLLPFAPFRGVVG